VYAIAYAAARPCTPNAGASAKASAMLSPFSMAYSQNADRVSCTAWNARTQNR
jgi:hypothetical protein